MKEVWKNMNDGEFLLSFAAEFIGSSTIDLEDARYAEIRMKRIGSRLKRTGRPARPAATEKRS